MSTSKQGAVRTSQNEGRNMRIEDDVSTLRGKLAYVICDDDQTVRSFAYYENMTNFQKMVKK